MEFRRAIILTSAQDTTNPIETVVHPPKAGAGIGAFQHKRSAVEHTSPATLVANAAMEENENQVQTMEETDKADRNYAVAEASMNLDGDITNFEVLDESQATNPETDAAAFVGTSNNGAFEPGNVNTVDNATTSLGTSVQGPPHVPESISGDGQEDVPDDLTADYSAKDHVVDAVMEEVEKQPTVARGNVEEGEWTVPEEKTADDTTKALEAMEAPKQQTAFKTVTASRVSLSPPPPNAAIRNDGISPVRNAMPSQQANLNSAGLINMDLLPCPNWHLMTMRCKKSTMTTASLLSPVLCRMCIQKLATWVSLELIPTLVWMLRWI
jgi:hypothetical protein